MNQLISELEQWKATHTGAEVLLSAVLEGFDGLIAVVGPCGEIISCNKAWVEHMLALGLTRERCGGHEWTHMMPAVRSGLYHVMRAGQSSVLVEYCGDTAEGQRWYEVRVTGHTGDAGRIAVVIHTDVTARKQAEQDARRSAEENKRLALVARYTDNAVVITDAQGRMEWVNDGFTRITGYTLDEVIGKKPSQVLQGPETCRETVAHMRGAIERGEGFDVEIINYGKNGRRYWLEIEARPILDAAGKVCQFIAIEADITERKAAEWHLSQAQKLESIGQMAAGVAHEINTPAQYVGDNTRFLEGSFGEILCAMSEYEAELAALSPEKAQELGGKHDLAYLREEVPKAIAQSLEGVGRISSIVRAMKEFSHPGSVDKEPADLNAAIESTVTVCRNRWKYVADLRLDLDPNLPRVNVMLSEINQMVLNLVVNAADAISDVVGDGSGGQGRITVSTRLDGTLWSCG
jgi:two-component system NtrC family sensor kinase